MPSKTNDELNFNNYESYCLLTDKIRYNDDNRKFIYASNKDNLLKRAEIFMRMQKAGIKYIIRKIGQDETKIYFKDRNLPFIIMLIYVIKYQIKLISKRVFTYILMKIKGIPDDYIRGRFVRQFIMHPAKKYEPVFRRIDDATELDSSERYEYKWNYINKDDKFKAFDKDYAKIVKKGNSAIRSILQSKAFEEYYKNFDYPVFDYKFHVSYIARDKINDELLRELAKLERKIGVSIVY